MRIQIIFLLMLILASCASNDTVTEIDNEPTPFNVSLDMSEDDVRALYADCDFVPSSSGSYGMCGGLETSFDVVRNDTVLFYFWNNDEENQIGGFILLDPKQSFRGVHVGMTVSEFLKLFPKATGSISLIDSSESLHTPQDHTCWFKLNTSEDDYAGKYSFEEGEGEFVKFIDKSKQIESIFFKSEG